MSEDPLCRELSPLEKVWLVQQAPNICLCARLSPEVSGTITVENIASAIEASRAQQPFLNVCINAEAKRFQRSGKIPLTSEIVEGCQGDEESKTEIQNVRQYIRDQLLGTLGIDRSVSLIRAHLHTVTGSSTHKYLILFGDHMCFDGKSFMIWMQTILTTLMSGSEPVESSKSTMFDFVDWTSCIPKNLALPEFKPFQTIHFTKLESEAPPGSVIDRVFTVPPPIFSALKAKTKVKNLRLNAPLMIAFFGSIGRVASSQQSPAHFPIVVRSCCAVDARQLLEPPLPDAYMNNSAGTVPVHVIFSSNKPLWVLAGDVQKMIETHIAAGEPFRLVDCTMKGDFATFGPYFDIPCLWSNLGHLTAPGVEAVECHISGAGSNPVITAHPIEVAGNLAITITYAPLLHTQATIESIGAEFLDLVEEMALKVD